MKKINKKVISKCDAFNWNEMLKIHALFFAIGILTVRSSLDREAVSSYSLLASAIDNGGKSCTTDIQLTVADVNDNKPIFVPVSGAVMISEGASVNTLVYRVSADDADSG